MKRWNFIAALASHFINFLPTSIETAMRLLKLMAYYFGVIILINMTRMV